MRLMQLGWGDLLGLEKVKLWRGGEVLQCQNCGFILQRADGIVEGYSGARGGGGAEGYAFGDRGGLGGVRRYGRWKWEGERAHLDRHNVSAGVIEAAGECEGGAVDVECALIVCGTHGG